MAKAAPKRKRSGATQAKPAAKKKPKAPESGLSEYLPRRETRTGNMQVERKMYADDSSGSDDFGVEDDGDDDGDDEDSDAPKRKRKNMATKKVSKTC